MGLDAQAIMVISGAVVALTQLVKWGGLPDRLGPLGVLAISLLGIVLWGWSRGTMSQATAFDFFAGWISVASSAAGIFGFVRSGPGMLASMSGKP